METSSIPSDLSHWGEMKLKELSLETLRSLCTEKDIDIKTRMKKEDLVELLMEWKKQAGKPEAPQKKSEGKQLLAPATSKPPGSVDKNDGLKKKSESKAPSTPKASNNSSSPKKKSPSALSIVPSATTPSTSPTPPQDLSGWGETKLTELKRDELLEMCQQRNITPKTSDTKETLVNALLKWKRTDHPAELSSPSSSSSSSTTAKPSPLSPTSLMIPKTIATPARLLVLTLSELKEWCRKKEVPCSGTKSELVERLCAYRGGIPLQKLSVLHLRDICEAESLSSVGTRADLLTRLSNMAATLSALLPAVQYEHKAETRIKKLTEIYGLMTKAVYRKKLEALGLIEPDQDIFHIIAGANGGADHSDNYHFAQNRAFNRAIGDRYDHVNCYLVGLEKAKKAVLVSVQFSSYKGPSAEELYKKGEAFWRDRRSERRESDKKKGKETTK